MINRELFDRKAPSPCPDPAPSSSNFLQARGLVIEYPCAGVASRPAMVALRDVDFHINQETITGLAGASGSGKSTLARCLAGLERPTRGEVLYRGTDVSLLNGAARLEFWRSVQLVPQNVADSLNPRFTAAKAVSAQMMALSGAEILWLTRPAVCSICWITMRCNWKIWKFWCLTRPIKC